MGFDDFLTQALTRRREALSPDTGGGFTSVPTDVNFSGLLVQRSSGESETGGRDTALAEYQLYYPPGTDILSSDIIIDAAGNNYDAGVPNDVNQLGCVGQMSVRLKRDRVL